MDFEAQLKADVLCRAIVRTGEYAVIDTKIVIDVARLAALVNSNTNFWNRVSLRRHEFFEACRRVALRTPFAVSDFDGPPLTDFLEEQLKLPALGVVFDNGSILILDGRKRAEQLFYQQPDAEIDVILTEAIVAENFVHVFEEGEARVFNAMLDRPLWVEAAQDDVGGDVAPFFPAAQSKKGRPPAEGDGLYLGALAALLGLELVEREKLRLKNFRKRRETTLTFDFNIYLSGLRVSIGTKEYSAFHPIPKHGKDLSRRNDCGKYYLWRRDRAEQRSSIERYFAEFGGAEIAEIVLDWRHRTTEDLQIEFVLVTRVHEAILRNRSAERSLVRAAGGRLGTPDGETIERDVLGTLEKQNEIWLDFDAQIELAKRTGVNYSKYFRNMHFVSDLLQWKAQMFFISRGAWRPIESQGEAEQFLTWITLFLDHNQRDPNTIHFRTRYYKEWREIFEHLYALKIEDGQSALDHARDACIKYLNQKNAENELAFQMKICDNYLFTEITII